MRDHALAHFRTQRAVALGCPVPSAVTFPCVTCTCHMHMRQACQHTYSYMHVSFLLPLADSWLQSDNVAAVHKSSDILDLSKALTLHSLQHDSYLRADFRADGKLGSTGAKARIVISDAVSALRFFRLAPDRPYAKLDAQPGHLQDKPERPTPSDGCSRRCA